VKRDQKAQAQARADRRVIVDREEYAALCALRDGAHEDLKLTNIRLSNRYDELLAVNREQLNRITRQNLELEHLRASLLRLEGRERQHPESEARIAELTMRCADYGKLQQELEEARMRLSAAYPVKFETPQPMFKK